MAKNGGKILKHFKYSMYTSMICSDLFHTEVREKG